MKRIEAQKDMIVFVTHHPEWGLCFIVDDAGRGSVIVEELLKADKHVRHYTVYGRMRAITTKEPDKIPLIDCPTCGQKSVPMNYKTTMVKGDKEIDIWECACCGKVPNAAEDVEIKAYVEL